MSDLKKFEDQLERGRKAIEEAQRVMRHVEADSPSPVEEKNEKAPSIRFVSKAPPPIVPVGGWMRPYVDPKAVSDERNHKNPSSYRPVLSDLAIKGRDCVRLKDEMKKIKNLARTRRLSISEIQVDHKDFLIWGLVETIPSDEDREIFRHPRQWPAGYISTFLVRYYGRSNSTIKSWIKAFHQELSQ